MLGGQARYVCLGRCLGVRNMLYILYKISWSRKCCSKFGRCGICMKYQRRWFKICTRGFCGKLCKIGVKTVDFSFFGPCLWCCSLVLEVCFAFQCDFFHWKRFPTFLILLSCPLQWETLFLYHPLIIRKKFWRTSHTAGESAANFTLLAKLVVYLLENVRFVCRAVLPLLFFSLDLEFLYFIWGSEVFIENLGLF